MFLRKFSLSAPVFLVVYVIDEAFLSQLRIIGGGFPLFLIFTLLWCALCEPEIAAMYGFGAGLLMDLSQSNSGPVGQWTLIMILGAFAVAYLGYGDNNFRSNPISLIFITSAAVFLVRLAYLVIGVLLGLELGSVSHILSLLLGQSLWTLVISPIVAPLVTLIHRNVFETRSVL